MVDILIADDDLLQVAQLKNVLSKEKDFRVIQTARNGKETLNYYFSLKPDVLLLDLDMPILSGLKVLEFISKIVEDSRKNIIVISGSTFFRSQISNVQKIKWIFTKPYDYSKIISQIKEIKNEKSLKTTFKKDLDNLFLELDIKSYTKGAIYLKDAICIAYYESTPKINISNIAKEIAFKNQVNNSESIQSIMDKAVNSIYFRDFDNKNLKKFFPTNYKFTTKDFISRVIYYIDNT